MPEVTPDRRVPAADVDVGPDVGAEGPRASRREVVSCERDGWGAAEAGFLAGARGIPAAYELREPGPKPCTGRGRGGGGSRATTAPGGAVLRHREDMERIRGIS